MLFESGYLDAVDLARSETGLQAEVAGEERPLIGRDPLWLLGSRPFSGRIV